MSKQEHSGIKELIKDGIERSGHRRHHIIFSGHSQQCDYHLLQ